jgi:hypothetical protein
MSLLLVGFAVGGDHALVDAPGRLDLDSLETSAGIVGGMV